VRGWWWRLRWRCGGGTPTAHPRRHRVELAWQLSLSIWDHPELYSSPFHANQTSFHANTVSHPHSSVDGTLVTHASVPNLNVQAADTFSSHNHMSAPDLHQACLAGQVTGSTNYFGFSENLDECGIGRSNSVPANFNQF